MKRFLFLLFLFLLIGVYGKAREIGYGGGLIYNIPVGGIGLDARMSVPLNYYGVDLLEGIWVVPQLSFFPIGNRMDFNVGTSIHLGVYALNKHLFYGLTNVSYSMWLDYDKSVNENAQFSNLYWDLGVGWTRSTCFRPFVELRFDVARAEPSLHAGYVYTLNCKNYGQVPCSKPPKDPFPAPKK